MPCNLSVDNFVMMERPIGDKHNSPKAITNTYLDKLKNAVEDIQ